MKKITALFLTMILLCASVAVLSPKADAATLLWPVPGHTTKSQFYRATGNPPRIEPSEMSIP